MSIGESEHGSSRNPPPRSEYGNPEAEETTPATPPRSGWQDPARGSLGVGSAYRPSARPGSAVNTEPELAWVPRLDGRSVGKQAALTRLLASWVAALTVWVVGTLLGRQLMPPADAVVPVNELGEILRGHLPCIFTGLFSTVAAGLYHRDHSEGAYRILGLLLVPVLGTVIGVVIGLPMASTGLGVLLYVTETFLGAALGVLTANWIRSGTKNS